MNISPNISEEIPAKNVLFVLKIKLILKFWDTKVFNDIVANKKSVNFGKFDWKLVKYKTFLIILFS